MAIEPLIQLDLASPVPAYRQIADSVRAQLVGGGVPPGTLLPTVRLLAVDLGVHHNTVAEAYRILAAEGWLDLTRRRGATVLERNAARATPEVEARFLDRLRSLVSEARAAGVPVGTLATELRKILPENGAVS
jgi:DNA-binding transcriptional regulator YhcF (GntR family)